MALRPRQTPGSTDEFLDLISDPFQSQIQVNSIYASIVWAFAVSAGLFFLFVFLRPRNITVYAPRAKHADKKHAPPPLGKTLFAWIHPVVRIEEQELVEKIGLDAVVFLRFLRMLRNIFLILSIIGCAVLIPINVVGGHDLYSQWSNIATLMKFTPQYIFGQKFWAYVALSYFFEALLFSFIWWNYQAILRLRRTYFNSHDYRSSLQSRTLLVTHLRRQFRTDSGLAQIVEEAKVTDNAPKTAIARNVRDLPELIDEHEKAVRKLESYLAKYLADPARLPSKRPMCKPFKDDQKEYGQNEIDAIEYLTYRIRKLEMTIEEIRKIVDQRDPMSYGFVSYTQIEDAHAVAHSARKKGPQHSVIKLAPKPNDLIWQNLPMSRASRRTKRFWNGLWMILLTIAFIPLNICSAVFLSDFSHVGLLWSGFNVNLLAHPVAWGIAQGIVAPTFQFLIFLVLPTFFRRLYNKAGDVSKTSRERHVMTRLYAFFIVNNLIVFSVFGSAFRFLASVIHAQDQDAWSAIRNAHLFSSVMAGLCNVSTFWLTYQMQQNLSAAIDIAQLMPLIVGWLKKKFTHPTPRQLIELSAPQPFDYAGYYNNYLYVATVGLCFGSLQPIIFPITAFYMVIELWFKRYLLQYVLITKTESGGLFWRTLVNRLLFTVLLGNAVIALIVGAQGVGSSDLIGETAANAGMLYAMVPLPFLVWAFKWLCSRTFDDKMRYYSTEPITDLEFGDSTVGTALATPKEKMRADRVAVRFGHPALYKKLIRPMVHAKSQHLLHEILAEELRSVTGDQCTATASSVFEYSDMYIGEMDHQQLANGKGEYQVPGFEVVQEQDLDFENFKKREEFRDQYGGDGELYGRPENLTSRSGTPSTFATLDGLSEMGRKGGRMTRSGTPSTFTAFDGHSERGLKSEDEEDHARKFHEEGGDEHSSSISPFIGSNAVGEYENFDLDDDVGYQHSPLIAPSAYGGYGRERSASVDVDVPEPGLDLGAILRAGSPEEFAR